jgi:general secretion pathway protein G
MNRRRKKAGGFTLIELLLVVAILSILATVVVVNLSGRREEAMISAARTEISTIGTALDLYEVDTGKYPSSLDALVDDDGSPNWNGPYIKQGRLPVDPWGNQYSYKKKERGYEIVCAGPDGNFGTDDDLTN